MKLLAGMALAVLLVVVPARPAHACSCSEPDPAAAVTVDITASRVEVRSDGQPDEPELDYWAIVDLRGEESTVVGPVPSLLDGVEIGRVPVLASVITDPSMGAGDSCNTPPAPAAGSDLRVTGHAYAEEGELVIWTGPCNGQFEVTGTAAVAEVDDDVGSTDVGSTWRTTLVLGVGLLVLAGFVVVPLVRRRRTEG